MLKDKVYKLEIKKESNSRFVEVTDVREESDRINFLEKSLEYLQDQLRGDLFNVSRVHHGLGFEFT